MTWLTNAWLGALALLLVGSQGLVFSVHQSKHLNLQAPHSRAMDVPGPDQAECLLCAGLQGFSFGFIDAPRIESTSGPRPLEPDFRETRLFRRFAGLPGARAPPASA